MDAHDNEYWLPEHVRAFLRGLGFSLPLEDMEPHIRAWERWMRALGDFYDYRDTDGVGRVYEAHRRPIHPARWAFGLGTDAWALWVDAGSREVRVRRYDTRMVVPSTRDEEGVTGGRVRRPHILVRARR